MALLLTATTVSAQKKPLDHSVYDSWNSIANTHLTADGKYLLYEVNPQEGDGKLIVRRVSDGKELILPRGYKAALAKDNQTVCALIKAPFAQIRQAKRDKKKQDDMPKDSLAFIQLNDMTVKKWGAIKSYKTGTLSQTYIAYIQAKAKDKKKKKNKKAEQNGDVLMVVNTHTGKATPIAHVSDYQMDAQASQLIVLTNPDKQDKKLKSSAKLYVLDDMSLSSLSEGKKYYGSAKFSMDGTQAVFLASTDTTTTGNKHCSLFYVKDNHAEEVIAQNYTKHLPQGWSLNENSAPEFSEDGKHIYLGVAPCIAPKDTTIYESEAAELDIWNYQDFEIQPQQKVNLERDRKYTYLSVISTDNLSELFPLTTSRWDKIDLMNRGNAPWALSQDNTRYKIQSQWDYDSNTDIALVNVENGERKTVATKVNARVQVSPEGKYLLWYNANDSAWYAYGVQTGKTVNLTKPTGMNFFDEEDDHPTQPEAYDREPLWMEGDKAVLIADRYDVWSFAPDGSHFENLTQGKGREARIQLRHQSYGFEASDYAKNWKEQPVLAEDGTLYLTAFDEQNKCNGIASVSLPNKSFTMNALGSFSFTGVVKASGADIFAYQKGNFENAYNQYLSSAAFDAAKEQCISNINPQQSEYNWGHVQLVHWKAFDGTPLDGLLYTPEDMDTSKKYPMMIYFYEKNSETLYNYLDPRPSRSIVNIPFYCSRGYVVFVPDIVYKVGHPGESAYNCIVAGAKAMCQQFQFVDSTRMAIQGQSWGGYQTAYLVTRTNIFAAAGAGAPVSNMTSAYGGIRWATGVCRQMQYEHGQSRIGATLWSPGGLDLYLENSPLFKADKVETPLLIMHNDADGAVPWYQGIEYFMALRRLGKKVWMLEYNKEAHNLVERRNTRDLSIRLQQFFDHYLKGDPMPAWMKYGVPATKKGQYFGTELAE